MARKDQSMDSQELFQKGICKREAIGGLFAIAQWEDASILKKATMSSTMHFSPIASRRSAPTLRVVHLAHFLFVGRLAEVKNLPLLLDAYGSYKRNGGLRNLEIVGHGPMETSLKASVQRARLEDSVQFFWFPAI